MLYFYHFHVLFRRQLYAFGCTGRCFCCASLSVYVMKLEEWIENGKDYPDIMRKFNRYLEKKEQDEVINKIKNEIKLILYNNREVVNNQIDL